MEITINTQGFSKEDIEELTDYLTEKCWDFKVSNF